MPSRVHQKLPELAKVKALLGIDPPHVMGEVEIKEWFFTRIERKFSRFDLRYKLIERAYDDAERAFKGKLRESGERYFNHIVSVAIIVLDYLRVADHEIIIAALLHDIVEDTDWTLEEIARIYGERVTVLVDYLTKPKASKFGGNKEIRDKVYHERFRFAPREFFLIKLPDRLHNLLTLWDSDEEKRVRKVRETELYYLLYAEEHGILIHELESALIELKISSIQASP